MLIARRGVDVGACRLLHLGLRCGETPDGDLQFAHKNLLRLSRRCINNRQHIRRGDDIRPVEGG